MKCKKDMIEESYNKCTSAILKADFYGYDPYDGLNSEFSFLKRTELLRLFVVYFNKFSPVNFRPLLRVKKSRQLMTVCTALNGLIEYPTSFGSDIRKRCDKVWEIMKKTSLKEKYGYHCWDAHGFPIQMRNRYTHGDVASVVGNQIFGEFLIKYYKATKNEEVREYILELRDFFIDEFYCENNGVCFFKYKSEHSNSNVTYNASLKAARYLIEVFEIDNSFTHTELIDKVFESVIKFQKSDGRWNYSYDFESDIEKEQVDFHQGFVLDDILFYMQNFGFKEPYLSAYKNGLEFYFKHQFLPNGQSIYRFPKKWPVNIHNQSQGIITFTKAFEAGYGEKYLEFAETILNWTLENMQGKDGHFYYLKYPFFTNKMPYMRWSDSNMLYAMANYLNYQSK